jgi:hypothetical protein
LGSYKVVVQAKDKTTAIIGLLNQVNQPKPLLVLIIHALALIVWFFSSSFLFLCNFLEPCKFKQCACQPYNSVATQSCQWRRLLKTDN